MVKLRTAAPDCAPGSCEEARRSGDGPANRPHLAAKPACRDAFEDWVALAEGYDGDPYPHLLVAMEPARQGLAMQVRETCLAARKHFYAAIR